MVKVCPSCNEPYEGKRRTPNHLTADVPEYAEAHICGKYTYYHYNNR